MWVILAEKNRCHEGLISSREQLEMKEMALSGETLKCQGDEFLLESCQVEQSWKTMKGFLAV
jgi:hypothetical protein